MPLGIKRETQKPLTKDTQRTRKDTREHTGVCSHDTDQGVCFFTFFHIKKNTFRVGIFSSVSYKEIVLFKPYFYTLLTSANMNNGMVNKRKKIKKKKKPEIH